MPSLIFVSKAGAYQEEHLSSALVLLRNIRQRSLKILRTNNLNTRSEQSGYSNLGSSKLKASTAPQCYHQPKLSASLMFIPLFHFDKTHHGECLLLYQEKIGATTLSRVTFKRLTLVILLQMTTANSKCAIHLNVVM
jgi:hypothetical protein